MNDNSKLSNSFLSFAKNTPKQQAIWMKMVSELNEVSALDSKTKALAYLSVLAALRLESGINFHVKHAKSLGATKDEVLSAILVGLPATGNIVVQSIPLAVSAYDEID